MSDAEIIHALTYGSPEEMERALDVAGSEHLALAFVGVCKRMSDACEDYVNETQRAETESVLRERGSR